MWTGFSTTISRGPIGTLSLWRAPASIPGPVSSPPGSATVTKAIRALFIREVRPDPPRSQWDQAAANTKVLLAALNGQQVEIEIFGPDGAVVGGRNVIDILRRQDFEGVTDIIVDISALSTGTGFPAIRYFVERARRSGRTANLHVFVVHDPRLDAEIRAISSDAPGYVHGFKGRSTLLAWTTRRSCGCHSWPPGGAPRSDGFTTS